MDGLFDLGIFTFLINNGDSDSIIFAQGNIESPVQCKLFKQTRPLIMEKVKILIVEDSITQAERLKYTLEKHNYAVYHEINGLEAFNSIRLQKPAIVVSDIVMPEMDGYRFCSLLKKDENLRKIPVILLTSLSNPEDVIMALECGADGFLVKPYSEEFLISRIEYFIQNSELRENQEQNSVLEILFEKKKYFINSSSRQILDVLLSTYDYAIRKNLELIETNKELSEAQSSLTLLNENLEEQVRIRTMDLEKSNANLIQEIEERKQARLELLASRDKAEESDRLKTAFLNNMSHEVRTPLNAIRGLPDMLSKANAYERDNLITLLKKSTDQLLALFENTMYLSRLQSENLPLTLSEFHPAVLIADIVQMFELPDLSGEIEIKINIPDDLKNLRIRSDEAKIRQVLSNLISNAIKYTLEGSIESGFVLHNEKITFYVQDTGIGISEKERSRIFDEFYRGEEAISATIRGIGLGLNISKKLVEIIGGNIGMDSIQGGGSRFYFTIPVEVLADHNARPSSVPRSVKSLKDITVLVVDDEMTNILIIDFLLSEKVKKVDHAVNGLEALNKTAINNYDIILMDIQMPVMGGLEATKELKKLYPNLPVIAQTAYTLPKDIENAMQAGCDEFISKPIREEALMEAIYRHAGISDNPAI
jgi:CheY-like chemotaxis protein